MDPSELFDKKFIRLQKGKKHISLRIFPEEFQIPLLSDWAQCGQGHMQDSAQGW